MKNSGVPVKAGMEKLIQMQPWMTKISRMGIPADLKVNSSTSSTMKMDTALTTELSRLKVFWKSYSVLELPTT